MKSLIESFNNKVYFHFVKSHREINNFMTYGNHVVDTLNIKRLNLALKEYNPIELSKSYKKEKKVFNSFHGDIDIEFYNGEKSDFKVSQKNDDFIVKNNKDIKQDNKRKKRSAKPN